MHLAEFITGNTDAVLSEWESFARGIWPQTGTIDPAELDDHAEAILLATVREMGTNQSLHPSASDRGVEAVFGLRARLLY